MKEVTLTELMSDLASTEPPLGIQRLLGELRHFVKGYHDDKYVLRFDNGYGAVVYDQGTRHPLTAYWIRWDGEAKELTDHKVAYDRKGNSTFTAATPGILQLELLYMARVMEP